MAEEGQKNNPIQNTNGKTDATCKPQNLPGPKPELPMGVKEIELPNDMCAKYNPEDYVSTKINVRCGPRIGEVFILSHKAHLNAGMMKRHETLLGREINWKKHVLSENSPFGDVGPTIAVTELVEDGDYKRLLQRLDLEQKLVRFLKLRPLFRPGSPLLPYLDSTILDDINKEIKFIVAQIPLVSSHKKEKYEQYNLECLKEIDKLLNSTVTGLVTGLDKLLDSTVTGLNILNLDYKPPEEVVLTGLEHILVVQEQWVYYHIIPKLPAIPETQGDRDILLTLKNLGQKRLIDVSYNHAKNRGRVANRHEVNTEWASDPNHPRAKLFSDTIENCKVKRIAGWPREYQNCTILKNFFFELDAVSKELIDSQAEVEIK